MTDTGETFRGIPLHPAGHPDPTARARMGDDARDRVPRKMLGEYDPLGRPDPVSILESQSSKLLPELVPTRYGRMLESPYAFFRGAAAIMAADLARTPDSGLRTQLCGDAHLANFGAFASHERRAVFDFNDFDETAAGPWEWDIKRLVTSLEVACRATDIGERHRRKVVQTAARHYRVSMRSLAAMTNLQVWNSRLEVSQVLAALEQHVNQRKYKGLRRSAEKAHTGEATPPLRKLSRARDGRLSIVSDPPLIVSAEDLSAEASIGRQEAVEIFGEMLRRYHHTLQSDRRHVLEEYEVVDAARKVIGVGSVGTRCWIVLLQGRDSQDPLFLQIKEAQESILEPYAGATGFDSPGERVVAGQRLLQSTSDIFLGWLDAEDTHGNLGHYYVRQQREWKGSADISRMAPEDLGSYGKACAWTLAKGHAQSGDRIAIASYLGGGDRADKALAEFADAYADQNETDYRALKAAAESGRIEVHTGG